VADSTRVIEHGRANDGSEEERREEIHRLVATAVAEDSVAVLEKYKEERGQHDRAAEGAAATVDALNRAAVDLLLVSDVPDRTAWVTDQPVPIGLDRGVAELGTDQPPSEVPLVDALVRGAWATGAKVRIVPKAGPVKDGIGALLRWS
jgi:hypothetical protein